MTPKTSTAQSMTPKDTTEASAEPPPPTTRTFRVIEGKNTDFPNSFPSPNDHVAHFPSAMYSLNSGTFPTQERTDGLTETGRANKILAALNAARREIRERLREATNYYAKTVEELRWLPYSRVESVVKELASQGVEKSGMSLSPEDKQTVVNQVLGETRSQMWTTGIHA